jgi:EAL domain-containing protein (putative c-di-GMP-specific phosphodiesterase class I)/PAS domain-containing protein
MDTNSKGFMPNSPESDSDYENERVSALLQYDILDTPAERTFDDITKLASLICETPVSLINFIDEDRQWSKAGTGIDTALTEMPRELVFCNQTILHDEFYEIPDTTKDEIFSESPLVKSSYHVRFYAGVPLINPEGFRLGALCVLDMKPKVLTESQKQALKSLAKIVVDVLETKRLKLRLQMLSQIYDTIDCNIFVFNMRTWACEFANSRALNITNYSNNEILTIHLQDIFRDIPTAELHKIIDSIVKKETPYFFTATTLKNKMNETVAVNFYLTLRKTLRSFEIIAAVFNNETSADMPETKQHERALLEKLSFKTQDDRESHNTLIHKQTREILEKALKNHEFLVYYQPIINVSQNKLISCEALLRWRDPNGKISLPINFIRIAEETGLIVEIGEWAIEQIANQIAAWKKDAKCYVPVAINLSPNQLKQDNLVDMLNRVIKEKNLSPGDITIELTESAIVEDYSLISSKMEELKKTGCKFALDDFGTGYSSLSYLTKFPVDKIKIDKSFVSEITSNSTSLAIIKTIISLAKNLKLAVVAEGVETQDQLNFLTKFSCDEIQGYLISKPISPEEFEEKFLRPLNQKT